MALAGGDDVEELVVVIACCEIWYQGIFTQRLSTCPQDKSEEEQEVLQNIFEKVRVRNGGLWEMSLQYEAQLHCVSSWGVRAFPIRWDLKGCIFFGSEATQGCTNLKRLLI